MSTLIRSIVFILCLSSCGPASQLRKAERLIAKAVNNGAKVDSIKFEKFDSLEVSAFHDAFNMTLEVKPTFVIQECEKLLKASPRKQKAIVRTVQEVICPQINIDTTYTLTLSNKDGIYKLPIHVVMTTLGGKSKYSIDGRELIVPIKSEETHVKISAGHTTWNMVVLAIVCLIVGYFTRVIFK